MKLRQVLINLLNNAIKYTDEGGVSVRVGTIKADRETGGTSAHKANCKLRFEIEDTGPGIARHEIERLFEPFVQTETGLKSQEGTGLGLPISRQFVGLMGGEMSVESEVGRGTIFKFYLPVISINKNNIKQKRARRRVISLEANQPRYRILIVDDRWDNRQLLRGLLNPLGFSLQEASNGQEAIEVWQAWEPDLIWMDMRMPVMNGIEATKRIKETAKGQATPIIALTASTFEEERALVLEAGCDDFLRKPFRETDIFDLMHKHLKVRYVYDDATSSHQAKDQEEPLTPALLATLPAKLLRVLQEAAEGSDIEMMEHVIVQISRHNPALANQLTTKADNFEYDEILQLIEEANDL
jgi:CheY-like chemotaxis protein/anti-sigma regulatory factor (Ser/Thr protein kinase)